MKKFLSLIASIALLVFLSQCEKPKKIVKVATLDVDLEYIAFQTASLRGEITDIGNAPVDDHGILLSTEPYPVFGNSETKSLGQRSDIGQFTANYNTLEPSTDYYFKAYTTTNQNSIYGETKQFKTKNPIELIVLSTTDITQFTHTTATAGGNITDDGGYGISDRGICWNLTGSPEITDSFLSVGSGTGSFTSTITGLTHATDYYVRAYATNIYGTQYGNEIRFTTVAQGYNVWYPFNNSVDDESGNGGNAINYGALFTYDRFGNANSALLFDDSYVDTDDPFLTGDYFTLNFWIYPDSLAGNIFGKYSSSGGPNIHGEIDNSTGKLIIDYSESGGNDLVSSDPLETKSWYMISLVWGDDIKLYVNGVLNDTNIDPGDMRHDVSFLIGTHSTDFGLTEGFNGIIDDVGIYDYSLDVTEISDLYQENGWIGKHRVFDFELNSYDVVHIGQQLWMAENLRTTHFSDGEMLTDGTSAGDVTDDLTTKYYFSYDDNSSNIEDYGLLYNWPAMMNGSSTSDLNPSGVQGVCPVGWHLPSDSEWKQMEMFLGMSQIEADGTDYRGTNEGGKLKEEGIVKWTSPNTGATDETRFTMVPGGYRNHSGTFYNLGDNGYFLSSTEVNSTQAWSRGMGFNSSKIDRLNLTKSSGFSVRCLKD